jgi:hypothetical protein
MAAKELILKEMNDVNGCKSETRSVIDKNNEAHGRAYPQYRAEELGISSA